LSRDPIGYEGSQWNLYEYVSSSPLFALDPFGLVRCGLHVWLYTDSWSVEDNVWEAATEAAGDSYSDNPVRDGLRYVATVNQTGVFDGTDSVLTALEEGEGLGSAIGPGLLGLLPGPSLGKVDNLCRAAPKKAGDVLDRLQEAKRQFQTNKEFRNWAHKEFMEDMKMGGGGRRNPDIPDSMIADAYDEWLELGKPKR
jgi:hypothetical protein